MFNFSFFNCYQAPGPHGEAQRFVYNHTSELDGTQIVIPIGGVPVPDFVNLVWDDQPMGNSFPPAPVTPAAAAAEAFGGLGAVPRFGPLAPAANVAHQTDKGIAYYSPAGVIRQEARWNKNAIMQRYPFGVNVYEFDATMDDIPPGVDEDEAARLYHLKIKGIVQARVDAAQANITTGDYLEVQNGSFNLVVDAADLPNVGHIHALETANADDVLIWVWLAGIDY